MKLETTASNLQSAMRALNGVIVSRSTIPVLGMVKFAGGKVSGTDLDIEVSTALPSVGKMTGEAAIDFRGLSALSKHIDRDEAVTLSEEKGLASVAFNGSGYTLPSCSASDFPDMEKPSGEPWASGNAGFVAALRRVRFAVSTEETRYYLNGCAVMRDGGGQIFICAADGHRLAMQPIEAAPDAAVGRILPARLVSYLAGQKGEPSSIVFDANKLRAGFEFPGLSVFAKLIDGTYPDIFRVIPKDVVPFASFEKQIALRALRRIAAFALDGWRGVKLSADAKGALVLLAKFGERSAREVISCEEAEPFEVVYNFHYLIQALQALADDKVTISAPPAQIAGKPAIISGDTDTLRLILMPMRV